MRRKAATKLTRSSRF